jgi:hypothetical protein
MRFSIRDLLWLTVVAAMGLGWWADRTDTAQRHDERITRAKQAVSELKTYPFTESEYLFNKLTELEEKL